MLLVLHTNTNIYRRLGTTGWTRCTLLPNLIFDRVERPHNAQEVQGSRLLISHCAMCIVQQGPNSSQAPGMQVHLGKFAAPDARKGAMELIISYIQVLQLQKAMSANSQVSGLVQAGRALQSVSESSRMRARLVFKLLITYW